MSASLPTTPHDVPNAPYREIADALVEHIRFIFEAQHSGSAVPAADIAAHAVAALATQHALADRILQSRWVTVRDALTHGATVDDVAAAMGLDVDEVVVGLGSWAAGQFRENLMTRPQFDATVALVDTVEQSGGGR